MNKAVCSEKGAHDVKWFTPHLTSFLFVAFQKPLCPLAQLNSDCFQEARPKFFYLLSVSSCWGRNKTVSIWLEQEQVTLGKWEDQRVFWRTTWNSVTKWINIRNMQLIPLLFNELILKYFLRMKVISTKASFLFHPRETLRQMGLEQNGHDRAVTDMSLHVCRPDLLPHFSAGVRGVPKKWTKVRTLVSS